MFKLLLILAIIFGILKFLNMRDEFRRRDAANARAAEEAEALEEEEGMRRGVIDVEFDVEENEDEDEEAAPEEPVVFEAAQAVAYQEEAEE